MFVKTNLQFILAVIIHKAGWDSSLHVHKKWNFHQKKGKENVSLDFSESIFFFNCFKCDGIIKYL